MVNVKKHNENIARFIGWSIDKKGRKFKDEIPPYGYVKVHPDHMQFNEKWDWLILVIEAIEEKGYFVQTDSSFSKVYLGDIYDDTDHTLDVPTIDRTFNVVGRFITEWNRQEDNK